MCFKIGQRVVLLDDNLEGTVVTSHNDMIEVKDDDGMIFQFHASEIIPKQNDQQEISKYSDINHPALQEKLVDKNIVSKPAFKKAKQETVMEVDLHISQLVRSAKGMSNFDMLNLQLDTAKHKLEFAIRKGINKIVFIHGVGEGVLKSELSYLFKKYPVNFYDASYQQYGLGATEVYIYKNPK